MVTFIYAFKIIIVGIIIGGGLAYMSRPKIQFANRTAFMPFISSLKMLFKFIGKAIIFIAILLTPFVILKLVGLI
jgi:hypothetical protein